MGGNHKTFKLCSSPAPKSRANMAASIEWNSDNIGKFLRVLRPLVEFRNRLRHLPAATIFRNLKSLCSFRKLPGGGPSLPSSGARFARRCALTFAAGCWLLPFTRRLLTQIEMSYHDSRDPGPIPPRWLHCPRKSATLFVNKFIAFKTPLDGKFDSQVSMENRFPPSMLFDSLKSYKVSYCSLLLLVEM